ncbi:hypothetical protein EP227_05850 [bacterium]|nr:MAG: hypothetical protein EP227_05850 [bacterium]
MKAFKRQTIKETDRLCSVCGKPGYVQQIPGVPVSDCFCDEHAPRGVIKPLHVLIILSLFIGIGWLMYIWFFD